LVLLSHLKIDTRTKFLSDLDYIFSENFLKDKRKLKKFEEDETFKILIENREKIIKKVYDNSIKLFLSDISFKNMIHQL